MARLKQHRSSRRVPPPKDSDFDHEINLVDRSTPSPGTSLPDADDDSRPTTAGTTGDAAVAGPSTDSGREPSDAVDAAAPAQEQDDDESPALDEPRGNGQLESLPTAARGPSVNVEQPTPQPQPDAAQSQTGGGIIRSKSKSKPRPKTPETGIDILYENQRGGFLCGMPLFSSKALGNLDPPAWTNSAHKPSPTDITTAQVPDPSWDWAWPEWRINHDDGVDEDGWEYSFMFSKKFSWHKASWWNSFVRRRAWIRKRVKKDAGYISQDPHMLNPEYFTIRPSAEIERDPSRGSTRGSRMSTSTAGVEGPPPIIETVGELLLVLRRSRIDREKIEAVNIYLDNAEDHLAGLHDVMHEIMSLFVFQASRRVLLTKLTEVYDGMVAQQQKRKKKKDVGTEDVDNELGQKVENLAEAVKHADEEVRRLEYWSDVKGMAVEGDSKGAVDHGQGWDPGWTGLDRSGPKAPVPKDSKKDEGDASSAEPAPDSV